MNAPQYMLPTFRTCPSCGSQIGWSIVLWHVEATSLVGAEAASDEVDEGDDPPVEAGVDDGDAVGGPAVTVVSFPLIVVSISAEDGPAVVDADVVVACRGTTAPARMPLAMIKRVKRKEYTAMVIKSVLATTPEIVAAVNECVLSNVG
jgi:hypothetical protein